MAAMREQVLAAVQRWPGIHPRALERTLGLPSKLATYHLRELELLGAVQHVSEPGHTRYFPRLTRPRLDHRTVAFTCLMRRPVALRIVVHLLAVGETTHKEMAAALRLAKAGTTYHLHLLRDAGTVLERAEGRRRHYRLAEPAWTTAMLANFTPLPDDLDAFESVWLDLFGGGA